MRRHQACVAADDDGGAPGCSSETMGLTVRREEAVSVGGKALYGFMRGVCA